MVAPGDPVRVEYHNGEKFPSSEVTVSLERLKDAKVLFEGGESALTGIRNEPAMTVADAVAPSAPGHFYLVSRTSANFIELDPAKFEEYLSHEGLNRIIEWRKQHGESGKAGREFYSKFAKSLLVAGAGNGGHVQPAGHEIEFVPLDDPYRPGTTSVRVQLLFRGKPAPGHEVELQALANGKVERAILGNTDAQGIVRAPVSKGGFHKLHAIIMLRREDRAQADWESYWATLTFGTR